MKSLYSKMSGMKAKLLWLCRECREFFDIPNEYCYVPDSHVIGFLYNIGFLRRRGAYSLEECIEISRNMSRFLSNTHFDLPFMRYDQKICTRCEEGELMRCRIDCRRNRTNSIAGSM